MKDVVGMYCFRKSEELCPHNLNDNCTQLRLYGECPDGVGKLVERLEELKRRICSSTNPREVEMLVTEAEMLDKTISDCVLRGDYKERFEKVRDEIF